MKVLVVVQARTGSTRLPGKVLMPLAGKPLLVRMLERLQAARTPSQIIVATTTASLRRPGGRAGEGRPASPASGATPRTCSTGTSPPARTTDCDAVSKIPSDCPSSIRRVVDRIIGAFLEDASVRLRLQPPPRHLARRLRRGGDEARRAGDRLARGTKLRMEREHTTPFIWERPERFKLKNVVWDRDLPMTHRLTIDYAEDYELIRRVYDALYVPGKPPFGLQAILDYLEAHPEVFALNQKFAGVNWYRHHLGELKTVDASQTRVPEHERKAPTK